MCRFALGSSSHPILSRAVVECVQQVTIYPALHSSPDLVPDALRGQQVPSHD